MASEDYMDLRAAGNNNQCPFTDSAEPKEENEVNVTKEL